MNKLIESFFAILIIIATFFGGYYYHAYINKKEEVPQFQTTGDTNIIKHDNIKQTKKETTFDTTSTGAGTITTVIQNPEDYKYTILLDYSIRNKAGVQFLYRYDRFVGGIGINSNPDVYVSAGIMF